MKFSRYTGAFYPNINGIPVSKCKCFTNDRVNYICAQYFAIWCMNHDKDILDYLSEQFDRMILADYLVGNSDEHPRNWGFLYDNNMAIISMAPLMDYDHTFVAAPQFPCQPLQIMGQFLTQEEAAISVAKKHPKWLRGDVNLSQYKYGTFVEERIEVLRARLNDPIISDVEHQCDEEIAVTKRR